MYCFLSAYNAYIQPIYSYADKKKTFFIYIVPTFQQLY